MRWIRRIRRIARAYCPGFPVCQGCSASRPLLSPSPRRRLIETVVSSAEGLAAILASFSVAKQRVIAATTASSGSCGPVSRSQRDASPASRDCLSVTRRGSPSGFRCVASLAARGHRPELFAAKAFLAS
jgi:hypothetical protein